MKKVFNILFIVFIFGIGAIGLITALFAENDVNEYENRPSERFDKFTFEGYMSGAFQDKMEKALGDRVNFAESMKKAYNDANSEFLRLMLKTMPKKEEVTYIKIGDKNVVEDSWLVFNPGDLEFLRNSVLTRAFQYNKLKEKYPEIDFYLYYIEKDTDINFETGEEVGIDTLLFENVKFGKENMDSFEINSFEDYKKYFFKTDHHWNAEGAYRGYKELAELLGVQEDLMYSNEKVTITENFSGSKATGDAAGYSEEFWVYDYKFPKMQVKLNGRKYDDYGRRDEFIKSKSDNVNYADFFGPDEAIVMLDNNREDKENILIIGESYDNAVLKLLATHFNCTHCVDLRGYKQLYKSFSLAEYVEKNNIDRVVFMGNIDYIVLDTFIVED